MSFVFLHKNIGKVLYLSLLLGIITLHVAGISFPEIISRVYAATEKEMIYESYIIPINADYEDIIEDLHEKEFIKRESSFKREFRKSAFKRMQPGAYMISKSMKYKEIAKVFKGDPYMKWIIIPEGFRKEQIADRLAKELEWTSEERQRWLSIYALNPEYQEGVYFPDTYLIGLDETPEKVMGRFITNFNKRFGPYLAQFNKQGIKWTTGVTLASLIEREAGGVEDMKLISGILWNRLNAGMKLDIDATLQYARGDTGKGWWASVTSTDKSINSPFNTYINKGVPPHPIANPGLKAIEAVLYPEETDCFYYLHDAKGNMYCSETYEEHKRNIEKYLK